MEAIEDAGVVASFERKLRQELDETVLLIDESKEYRAPVELDQQSVGRLSRMDAMQQQAMAQDINRRRLARKVAIEQALSRIRDGEYGYCIECGEPVGVARLNVDPVFATCVRCAR